MLGKSIVCPECQGPTRITCQKFDNDFKLIRRYRRCVECHHRFRTTQPVEKLDDDGRLFGQKPIEKGAHHYNATFKAREIRTMRFLWETQRMRRDELALLFDCSETTIHKIVHRISYKKVK